jgi:PAS domain S-box-containing protein
VELNDILADAADGACSLTPEGRIAFWNKAAERILGYSSREVVGKPCWDIFVGRDVSGNRLCYPMCHILKLVSMNEPVQHFGVATRDKSGNALWLDVSILAVPQGRTGAPNTLHLFRDVTHQHRCRTDDRDGAIAAQPAATPGPPGSGDLLTRREFETLRLMAAGASTKAMAARLSVSPATVRNHVQNILVKLGVHSRLEAVVRAASRGLIVSVAAHCPAGRGVPDQVLDSPSLRPES